MFKRVNNWWHSEPRIFSCLFAFRRCWLAAARQFEAVATILERIAEGDETRVNIDDNGFSIRIKDNKAAV